MGIFDKIMFWRKKEPLETEAGLPKEGEAMPSMEPGLPEEREIGLGEEKPLPGEVPSIEPTAPGVGPSMPAPTALGEQQQFAQATTLTKDMEIISAKLDSIRATLENVNQRIAHLEKIASESEHETEKRQIY